MKTHPRYWYLGKESVILNALILKGSRCLMTKTVYTTYWINERADVKKEHGSFETEQKAVQAVKAWWEIHKETYDNIIYERTNSDALEILYGDPNYYYRIEEEETSEPLPATSYKVKTQGEIEALRKRHQLDDVTFLFDELPEPYRDRLIRAMGDSQLAREYSYTKDGKPIVKAFEKVQ